MSYFGAHATHERSVVCGETEPSERGTASADQWYQCRRLAWRYTILRCRRDYGVFSVKTPVDIL